MTPSKFDALVPWTAGHCAKKYSHVGAGWFVAKSAEFQQALMPAPTAWIYDRLSMLILSMGHTKSEATVAAWLHETQRLLADLPADICAQAVDEAIKAPAESSLRGFMPSVALIRSFADPLVRKRRIVEQRLRSVAESLGAEPASQAEVVSKGIDPAEVCDFNLLMRRMGLKTRAWADGCVRELADGESDPVREECVAETSAPFSQGAA